MKKFITACAIIGVLLAVNSDVKGVLDPCLSLHFDGSDGDAWTVDSSAQNHPVSLLGGAQIDTAFQAEGGASLLLDGSSDYASLPDSSDWDICASIIDSWTIDFQVRFTDHTGDEMILAQDQATNTKWHLMHSHSKGWRFYLVNGGTTGINMPPDTKGEITDSLWHHIAFCKVGTEYGIYVDGVQVGFTTDSDTFTLAGPLTIGRYSLGGSYFDGNLDELRITHDNIFDASPNSSKSDVIALPEPATICMLGLGALGLICRKKR
jgi:hypothetical protein